MATAKVKVKVMMIFFISDNLEEDWLQIESYFTTNIKSERNWLGKPTADSPGGSHRAGSQTAGAQVQSWPLSFQAPGAGEDFRERSTLQILDCRFEI